MKFIYFDRLLFLNDDFELGLPIFFMFELLLYYMRSISILYGSYYTQYWDLFYDYDVFIELRS